MDAKQGSNLVTDTLIIISALLPDGVDIFSRISESCCAASCISTRRKLSRATVLLF